MAKTAPEIIGFALGWDMADVKDGLYQRHRAPGVYVCGDDYYCCPTTKQKLPEPPGGAWGAIGIFYGRAVFCSEALRD